MVKFSGFLSELIFEEIFDKIQNIKLESRMTEFFGTDGIRGVVGKPPLTADFFLKLGKSTGEVLANNSAETKILIGRDTPGNTLF